MKFARPIRWLIGLVLALSAATAHAEAFKVLHFHADITLNQDGTFDVVEDILLEFSESRHGFLRKIPFRYSGAPNIQGELAEGHVPGQDYLTPISEIRVDGREYAVTKGVRDYEVKIGSASEYVSGRQRYVIHYKVYGAINFFSKHSEFYWNVNGNDWEVEFDTLDATVHLPDRKLMSMGDLQAFTGALGGGMGGVAIVPSAGKVDFLGTRRFGAGEGLTVSLRMPKGYLRHDPVPLRARADKYLVQSLVADLHLQADGSIEVEEALHIEVLVPNEDLLFNYGLGYSGPVADGQVVRAVRRELLDSQVDNGKFSAKSFATLSFSDYQSREEILQLPKSNFPEAGTYVVRNRYRMWGATYRAAQGLACYVPYLTQTDGVPVAAARVTMHWGQETQPTPELRFTSGNLPASGQVLHLPKQLQYTFEKPLELGEEIHFGIVLPGQKVNIAPTPMRIMELSRYYSHYHVDMEIREDGTVHVVNTFGFYQDYWYAGIDRPITLEYNAWHDKPYRQPQPQFWGNKGYYLLSNLQFEGERQGYAPYDSYADEALRLKGLPEEALNGRDTLTYSFDIAGILRDSAGTKWLEFPIVEYVENPADHVTFSIKYPGGGLVKEVDLKAWLFPEQVSPAPQKFSWVVKSGEVRGELVPGLAKNQALYLRMPLPAGAVPGSFGVTMKLFWLNHKAFFFPFFLLIPLVVVWFIWGRDKRSTIVVEFYPPTELTPAEAGMLIDDKLQNRDLLALIYYWGAQGVMTIDEVYGSEGGVTDYKFTKLKNLPKGARKYEKTIFDGLFANGNTTTISAQKHKFYTFMATARTELEAHVKAKQFYVPGTRGWALAMQVLGWIVVLIAIILAGMVLFEASLWYRSRWEIPLGWGACAALLLAFARIMPKKAGFGLAQYRKLKGFQEFVVRADKAKLEELVGTNPDYFGMTLPYAIALGIATKWVEQFGDLLKAPPSYYHTTRVGDMDYLRRQQFDLIMRRQLDAMAHSFNSHPPSQGGGGSSSSYSSSSSSSSSYSSYSGGGGSSYSSGGGYSGGGYGGGGGSSW